jgi:biopolymer transport protein ExbD
MNLLNTKDGDVIKKAELSLTPMIDVVFLLLIFFMVGMKFKEYDRKLEADLPKAGQEATDDELLTEIWVRIAVKSGSPPNNPQVQYYVDQQAMRDKAHLKRTLRRYSNTLGARNDPVIVAPTDDAWHGWVMTVLDYLNELGFKSINFKQ